MNHIDWDLIVDRTVFLAIGCIIGRVWGHVRSMRRDINVLKQHDEEKNA